MKQYALKQTHLFLLFFVCLSYLTGSLNAQSWTADNGNGTFTNPLFFEEFSDPCMVRVGDDYFMTGTTNHCMPGLPILHSYDLVNWRLVNYIFDRFDLGPEFSFQDGKDMYGNGIWAPSFIYHEGVYYIFANVNGHTTQVYKTTDPCGKWEHSRMNCNLHDLSVFFDDDGKKYVSWGVFTVKMAELNEELTDTIPGTSRVIAENVGEGAHIYKIDGKYILIWAVPGATTPMLGGKSDNIYGPYEVVALSEQDHMGVGKGYTWEDMPWSDNKPFKKNPQDPTIGYTLHQGGIIQTQTGEWWGYSMQDHNSLGRVVNLAPVTWENGFPYFGLPGNLTKSPRTWIKPNVGKPQQPIVTMIDRNDDFPGDKLGFQWQWNHLPDDTKWSLIERPGHLRLHSLPATDFWHARNSLTQRSIGPVSTCTIKLDATHLKEGDIAGLALLNYPYAWIGIEKQGDGYRISMFDYTNHNEFVRETVPEVMVQQGELAFRVHTDFDTEKATFSYSVDGKNFQELGNEYTMVFQTYTFQGVRYALFNFNQNGIEGGYADFDNFRVDELYPEGFRRPIPYNQTVELVNKADNSLLTIEGVNKFQIIDMELGRVALQPIGTEEYISINSQGKVSLKQGIPGANESFQWTELERGDLVLLSLATNRYLNVSGDNEINALVDVPSPTRKDGTSFVWK